MDNSITPKPLTKSETKTGTSHSWAPEVIQKARRSTLNLMIQWERPPYSVSLVPVSIILTQPELNFSSDVFSMQ